MDILRSRRRTFSSILGVLLAVTFIAGTFIAIDSSTRATLDAYLNQLGADFTLNAQSNDTAGIRAAVLGVSGVTDLALFMSLPYAELESESGGFGGYANGMGIEPDHLPSLLTGYTIEGTLELPRGTVGLSTDLASTLQVGIGDRVTAIYREYNPYDPLNLTERRVNLTVAALLQGSGIAPGPVIGPYPGPYYWSVVVIHIRDTEWFASQLNQTYYSAATSGEVRIDHEQVLDPYNMDASLRNIGRLERQLNSALLPFRGSAFNQISSVLSFFNFTLSMMRVMYLALSMPVLLLGLYLGAVGVDLGHAERRRELAVLKTRGAGPRQVLGLLTLEAVLGGILAAVVGLVAGIALSRFLIGYVNPFAAGTTARYDVFSLSVETIVVVVILSVLLMATVSYRSAKRTAKLPIVETLRYYATGETKIEYRLALDLVLLGLGIAILAGAWYARTSAGDFFLFFVGAIFTIMLPIAPILIIITATRLLTRSTGRVYELAARAFRPVAKHLHYVIDKNLARNPRRSANIAVIIALGLAFGMFIFAFYGSLVDHDRRVVRDTLGADMVVTGPPQSDAGFASNVSAIPSVAGVTTVTRVYGSVSPCCSQLVALEPGTYFDVSQPEGFYFEGAGAETLAGLLGVAGNAIVSRQYMDEAFLEIGDRLTIWISDFNRTTGMEERYEVNVTIAGAVRGLPGAGTGYGYSASTIFASPKTLEPILGATTAFVVFETKVLLDLDPDADWSAVRESLAELGGSGILVYAEELDRLAQQPAQQSILGFVRMEIAFIVVILTAGLALILYAATMERDVEFAAVMARGASGWQAAAVLVGEAFAILVIGLAIGAGIGLVSAYFFLTIITAPAPFGGSQVLVPYLFGISVEGLLLLVLAPAAMLIASLVVSLRIARMDIARVLKIRGG